MTRILTAAIAVLATATGAAAVESPSLRLQKALEGRVAGTPVRCIAMQSVTSSEIIDGTAIIYRVGSTLYVNTPSSGAGALRNDDVAVTRLTGSQLCNIDTVNLVDRSSRVIRSFVVLGDFVPYTKPKAG